MTVVVVAPDVVFHDHFVFFFSLRHLPWLSQMSHNQSIATFFLHSCRFIYICISMCMFICMYIYIIYIYVYINTWKQLCLQIAIVTFNAVCCLLFVVCTCCCYYFCYVVAADRHRIARLLIDVLQKKNHLEKNLK